MAKVVLVMALMVFISSFVEGRDWQFQSKKRLKRDFKSGFGSTYGRSDENESLSRESLNTCGDRDRSYSGSREQLAYNRDGHFNDNQQGRRSFSKSSASASASSSSQNHNYAT